MPEKNKIEDVKKQETLEKYKVYFNYWMQDNTYQGTAKHFGISMATVQNAVNVCKDAGLFNLPDNDELLTSTLLEKLRRKIEYIKEWEKEPGTKKIIYEVPISSLEKDILTMKGLIETKIDFNFNLKPDSKTEEIGNAIMEALKLLPKKELEKFAEEKCN